MEEMSSRASVLSPGIAVGKACLLSELETLTVDQREIDVETELKRFNAQLDHIKDKLSELSLKLSAEGDAKDAEIIAAQRIILTDEVFKKKVSGLISGELISMESAVERAMEDFARRMEASSDEYLRERANDLIDLARYFKDRPIEEPDFPEPKIDKGSILVVGELFPSTVLTGRRYSAAGILAEKGAPTSHSAILARSLGIPVLAGASPLTEMIRNGDTIILDGYYGAVTLHPEAATLTYYAKRIQYDRSLAKVYKRIKNISAKTKDGVRIDLGVNIGRLDDLRLFSPSEIDEVGLFRTEFLFMFDQADFPTFEQQAQWYDKIVKFMKGKPVTFRALDVGGDKFLPYFSMGTQNNPHLGLRAHRIFRYHPEILETQLRAILHAARSGPVKILYPMINNLEEIDYLNEILSRIEAKDSEFQVGIMVETPASVLMIREIMEKVDFVSIGTNDLVQYALTVDRDNENVMLFYQPFHPVILRMIKQVVNAAEASGKRVSICGEIASDPRWTPLLLGLGARSLSMAPLLAPPIKRQILSLNLEQCRSLAEKALSASYIRDVERHLDEFFAEKADQQ